MSHAAVLIWTAIIFGGDPGHEIETGHDRPLMACVAHVSAILRAHPGWTGLCATVLKDGTGRVVAVERGDRA